MPEPTADLDLDMLDAERRRASRGAHRERRKLSGRIMLAIAAMSAIVAVFAAGAPTEITAVDAVYKAAYGAGIAVAASRAKRWTWFVTAGAAGAVGAASLSALGLAVAALATAYWSMRYGRRQRELGALVGALAAQSLLRLPTDLAFAVPTLTAALAPLPLVVSAIRNTRRPSRYVAGIGIVAAVLAVVGGLFGVTMLGVQQDARDGITAARDGLAAASDGDDAEAEQAFAAAASSLRRANDAATAWWLYPARAVPVLAQHIDAVDDISREGEALAELSVDQIAVLDIDGLGAPDGGFDVARVAALQPVARRVSTALTGALATVDAADSPWLVAPVTDRIDQFRAEIAAVEPAARNAADALELAPSLLGVDGPKSYVVLVGNPAEARELGGFVAAIGVLTADRGALDFRSDARITEVNRLVADAGLTVTDRDLPQPLPASSPTEFAQNWANTVDFATVAEITTTLGPAVTGAPVDGVLYVDPYSLAALLRLTGPVTIEGVDTVLDADNAADYLLRGQYLTDVFDSDGQRKELLADTARAAFDRLTSGTIPDPRVMANTLAPLVQARRLWFATTDDAATALLTRVGLLAPLNTGATDQVLVAQENLRANKLDAYLERTITYDVTVDEAGNASATLSVALTNTAPATGLPDIVVGDGDLGRPEGELADTTARISLDLYTVLDPIDAQIDGAPTGTATSKRDRLTRTGIRVDIPAGATVTVTMTLGGVVDADGYTLAVVPNGTANPDRFTGSIARNDHTTALSEVQLDRIFLFAP